MFKIKLSDIRFLSKEEENNLLFGRFNDTRASYPKDATLVSLFEEQAARQGDRVAVKRGERVLTYRELNEEANRLAHALRERGLAREEVVGLHFDRTPEMIIALLAVLKAGGAYLPVDPTYPEERKSFMLTDGGARFLLAESRENLPGLCRGSVGERGTGSQGVPPGESASGERSPGSVLHPLHLRFHRPAQRGDGRTPECGPPLVQRPQPL